jgi:hypothetical protein
MSVFRTNHWISIKFLDGGRVYIERCKWISCWLPTGQYSPYFIGRPKYKFINFHISFSAYNKLVHDKYMDLIIVYKFSKKYISEIRVIPVLFIERARWFLCYRSVVTVGQHQHQWKMQILKQCSRKVCLLLFHRNQLNKFGGTTCGPPKNAKFWGKFSWRWRLSPRGDVVGYRRFGYC